MREIALHMADIAENALVAGAARIKLSVTIDRAADRLTTAVEDNGRGMDEQTLSRCTDPFMTTRTARRVGLGIALYKLSAEQSGGSFTIRSEQGRGTRAALIAANPETDFTLEYAADGKAFAFATDTIPYHDRTPAFAAAAKKEIQQRIDEINGGAEPI